MDIDINSYRARLVDERVDLMLDAFGCVAIEGPKWCGETWTSVRHSNSSFMVGDPANDFSNRRLARMDANLVLPGAVPHLIYEWQGAPAIWNYAWHSIDEQAGNRGRYVLTGSSTPRDNGDRHSGAGRIGRITGL